MCGAPFVANNDLSQPKSILFYMRQRRRIGNFLWHFFSSALPRSACLCTSRAATHSIPVRSRHSIKTIRFTFFVFFFFRSSIFGRPVTRSVREYPLLCLFRFVEIIIVPFAVRSVLSPSASVSAEPTDTQQQRIATKSKPKNEGRRKTDRALKGIIIRRREEFVHCFCGL